MPGVLQSCLQPSEAILAGSWRHAQYLHGYTYKLLSLTMSLTLISC